MGAAHIAALAQLSRLRIIRAGITRDLASRLFPSHLRTCLLVYRRYLIASRGSCRRGS